jgi:hypothetical protein
MRPTYREAIAEALRLAVAASEADDVGGVRTWAHWAHCHASDAYRLAAIRDDDGLRAALDREVTT